VRRSGFDPQAPPLREGSTYVVRATDFRGILMRVVVDARSGAIRDVNRIVPGPGSYGQQAGMVPYRYGPEPDDMPYGQPADYDLPAPLDNGQVLAPPRPGRMGSPTRASVTVLPPLPRPRPPELASRNAIDETKPETKPGPVKPTAVSDGKPAGDAKSADKSADRPIAKSEVAEPAAAAAPATMPAPPATAAAKPGKSLQPPPIND
jgi:hypothetical protein